MRGAVDSEESEAVVMIFAFLPGRDGFEPLMRKQSCTQSAGIVETTHVLNGFL